MIIFIYGENSYQSTKRLNILKKEFILKYSDINFESIDASSIDDDFNFLSHIDAMPFLAEKRMIVIRNLLNSKKLEDTKANLLTILKKCSESSIVIFYESYDFDMRQSLFKLLKTIAKVEEYTFYTPKQLSDFILDYLSKDGYKIGNEEILLLSHLWKKKDIWSLTNELSKLKLFLNSESRNNVTTEDIKKNITFSSEAKIFDLVDLIGRKKQNAAIRELDNLLASGENEFYIHTMIVRQFRILILIKSMTYNNATREQIMKELKFAPFVISKGLDQVKNYTFEELIKIYKDLLDIEIDIKKGNKDAILALSCFVASVSK